MSTAGPRIRVLVADDDPLARSLISSVIAKMKVECVEVEDGEAAWIELRKGNFAAAVIDLEMPGFDGFELIGCLRGHPRTSHIPVIVISAREDKPAIDKALQAGATTYITKPVHWSAFSAHIAYLLDLTRRAETAEYVFRQTIEKIDARSAAQSQALSDLARRLDTAATLREPADMIREHADIAGSLRRLALELAPPAPGRKAAE